MGRRRGSGRPVPSGDPFTLRAGVDSPIYGYGQALRRATSRRRARSTVLYGGGRTGLTITTERVSYGARLLPEIGGWRRRGRAGINRRGYYTPGRPVRFSIPRIDRTRRGVRGWISFPRGAYLDFRIGGRGQMRGRGLSALAGTREKFSTIFVDQFRANQIRIRRLSSGLKDEFIELTVPGGAVIKLSVSWQTILTWNIIIWRTGMAVSHITGLSKGARRAEVFLSRGGQRKANLLESDFGINPLDLPEEESEITNRTLKSDIRSALVNLFRPSTIILPHTGVKKREEILLKAADMNKERLKEFILSGGLGENKPSYKEWKETRQRDRSPEVHPTYAMVLGVRTGEMIDSLDTRLTR